MIIIILSILLIIFGFIGVLLPFVPGITLMFIGILLYAVNDHFLHITQNHILIFAILTIVSIIIDYLSGIISAKLSKASKYGLIGAVVGSLLGLLIFGFLGIIIGPAVGVFIFEYLAFKSLKGSSDKAIKTLIGSLISLIINFAIAVFIIIFFIVNIIR